MQLERACVLKEMLCWLSTYFKITFCHDAVGKSLCLERNVEVLAVNTISLPPAPHHYIDQQHHGP
jgi:hypothetical protein